MIATIFIIAGIIQGILEWIPISSEGFLFIYFTAIGMNPIYAFVLSVAFHLPTAIAAFIYFHRDFKKLILLKFGDKTVEFLVISTISTAITAIPLYIAYKSTLSALESTIKEASVIVFLIVGFTMVATGFFVKSVNRKISYKKIEEGDILDYFLVGLIQGLAIIPGVTRSGVTMAALIWRRFDKEDVIRGSFLMAPIVSLGALFLELILGDIEVSQITSNHILLSLTVALIVSLLTIDGILKIVRNLSYWKFLIFIGVLMIIINSIYLIVFF